MPDPALARVVSSHDLLTHSFYQRWVAGDLSLGELREYACQYAFAARALPRWLRAAAAADAGNSATLSAHAAEEEAHVGLWEDFARALGVTDADLVASTPNPATASLLAAGERACDEGSALAAAWALEVQTPRVSESKLQGLRDFYDIGPGNGGRYFELHATRDLEHAAELEALIEASPARAAAPVAADAVLTGLWDLLSSVERAPVS